jgi:hypothetical protein
MNVLGTHHTLSTGVSPGVTPSATLTHTGLGEKLKLDLGSQVLLIHLGTNPRAALTALRDDLDALLSEEAA